MLKQSLFIAFVCLSLCVSVTTGAQNAPAAATHHYNSWAAWFNNVKFSNKWGLNNDIQLRVGESWNQGALLLVRPGVNYYLKPNQTITAGYAFTLSLNDLPSGQPRIGEHRIWEQYIFTHKIGAVSVQHRARLEQRFLQRPADADFFAQRARYFFRGIIPLTQPTSKPFAQGLFASVQNELFFNIQNKEKLNGKVFDQNRAYASVGYRFSPKYDLELGYMYQFIERSTGTPNTNNHIAQIAFYTRL